MSTLTSAMNDLTEIYEEKLSLPSKYDDSLVDKINDVLRDTVLNINKVI